MAVERLRKDVKLYDWIANEEIQRKSVFRIYFYEGHIMIAIPRKQFAKVALDTERAEIAYDIVQNYGFVYNDENQLGMYQEYGDSFGNEIWITQERQKCILWVGFCQHHELCIQLECKTKKYAKELLETIKGSSYIDDNEYWLQITSLEHFKKETTYNSLSKKLEELFEVIP